MYGANHDYLDIVSAAAPFMLHKPLDEILKKLPLKLAVTWVRHSLQVGFFGLFIPYNLIFQAMYHDRWSQVLRAAFTYYKDHMLASSRQNVGFFGAPSSFRQSPPTTVSLFGNLPMSPAVDPSDRCCVGTGTHDVDSCAVQILVRLGQGVGSLTNLHSTFATRCEWAKSRVKPWQASVEENIRKIPQFDSFFADLC
jgi:hypothetical protein